MAEAGCALPARRRKASRGPSGWMVQWDAGAKEIKGFVQVYYKDKPVSALIPYTTRDSCFDNFIIIDIQQIKPLP